MPACRMRRPGLLHLDHFAGEDLRTQLEAVEIGAGDGIQPPVVAAVPVDVVGAWFHIAVDQSSDLLPEQVIDSHDDTLILVCGELEGNVGTRIEWIGIVLPQLKQLRQLDIDSDLG